MKTRYSEHQTGLIDILAVNYTDMDETENTEECRWLHNNMYKYGLSQIPKGKENVTGYNYEPRIYAVGTDHSYKIKEEGLTLEEYLDY